MAFDTAVLEGVEHALPRARPRLGRHPAQDPVLELLTMTISDRASASCSDHRPGAPSAGSPPGRRTPPPPTSSPDPATAPRSSAHPSACTTPGRWARRRRRPHPRPAGGRSARCAGAAPGSSVAGRRVEPRSPMREVSPLSQSIQVEGPSWQYALLFPPWERPSSSPWDSIGTPWERSSEARRLRRSRARSARTAASSVGPSTPRFQLRLSSAPSRLPSPFASLCLSR